MKLGIALAKQIKTLDFPETHQREMRAMYVAQALAYQGHLPTGLTAEEYIQEKMSDWKVVINDVNEMLVLDTKLTFAFLEKLVKSRKEVVESVADTTLLKACLSSDSITTRLTDDQQAALNAVASRPNFGQSLLSVRDAFEADSE